MSENKEFDFESWDRYKNIVNVETFDKIIRLLVVTYGHSKEFVPNNSDQKIIKEIREILEDRCEKLCK